MTITRLHAFLPAICTCRIMWYQMQSSYNGRHFPQAGRPHAPYFFPWVLCRSRVTATIAATTDLIALELIFQSNNNIVRTTPPAARTPRPSTRRNANASKRPSGSGGSPSLGPGAAEQRVITHSDGICVGSRQNKPVTSMGDRTTG